MWIGVETFLNICFSVIRGFWFAETGHAGGVFTTSDPQNSRRDLSLGSTGGEEPVDASKAY
jgi:hypothetical protein